MLRQTSYGGVPGGPGEGQGEGQEHRGDVKELCGPPLDISRSPGPPGLAPGSSLGPFKGLIGAEAHVNTMSCEIQCGALSRSPFLPKLLNAFEGL